MRRSVHAAHPDVECLDSNAADILMDAKGRLIDFKKDVVVDESGAVSIGHGERVAIASDRLHSRMPHAMPQWDASPEVKARALELASKLLAFFKAGRNALTTAYLPIKEMQKRVILKLIDELFSITALPEHISS